MTNYVSLRDRYRAEGEKLKGRLALLSTLRLLMFIGFALLVWRSVATGNGWVILLTIVVLAGFLLSIRLYDRWEQETRFYKALVKLNEEEISFLETGRSVYANGKEYIDPTHPYSYDLDLFGEGGIFAYLNRCSTAFGKDALAAALLRADTHLITERQAAIEELKELTDFRQHLQARGLLLDTKEKEMKQLGDWLEAAPLFTNRNVYYGLMIFPILAIGSLGWHLVFENALSLNLFGFFFVLNLVIALSFSRKISAHLSVSTSVTKILQQYAGQLKQLESMSFRSSLLKQLQQRLRSDGVPASASIGRLASLFNYLETIVNLVVSLLLNGLFIFHVHILFRLENWKALHGKSVFPWLRLLGNFEELNSFANLSNNNPGFALPVLSTSETLSADNMGHPLIREGKRVLNSISFQREPFVVLTGSNMSGKSTFLRTLGINLVLARAGSRVCATSFTFYPYSVHVSMRITDSLQDSESFFYAELKRLQAIIVELNEGKKTFVILDEILRGTNSNDKHSGTVGLINKLVAAKACGIIATHDLTVSEMKGLYPAYLGNQCFESEIINDELVFDYKLKPGVCSRLSASFLMKKMGVID